MKSLLTTAFLSVPLIIANVKAESGDNKTKGSDIIIEDFESGNFGFWKVEGTAFGKAPVAGNLERQKKIEGSVGKYLANSFHGDDAALGKLTSKSFVIEKDYISFHLGGGKHEGKTCMNLVVGGKVVASATGNQSSVMDFKSWDVKKWKGKKAHLEIIDSVRAGWGFIIVDEIKQTSKLPAHDLALLHKTPDNFRVTEYANGDLIDNPISLAIDRKNRIYVAEVGRLYRGVEDTRRHNYWMKDEVAIHSLKDRSEMYKKWIAAGKFEQDHFTGYSDSIVTLFDDDNDGKADRKKEFAGGFNGELEGNGCSIAFDNEGSLYYTNVPNVWKLTDTTGDGVVDKRVSLFKGFGLRLGVNGHDLHGLVWGSDGRLYFSIGDRGYDVVSKEGKHFHSGELGAVFRCEPDGSNLEFFTTSNRNPFDIEFDQFSNLFTVDNNRGNGDRSRVCYLVEGGEYSWNSGYENITTFRWALDIDKRQGPAYSDAWMEEGAWKTPFEGQPAYCIPSLGYIDGGAAGLLFNSGESLGEKFENSFLYTACGQGMHTFKLEAAGAGMKLTDVEQIWEGGYLVDLEQSMDGVLYLADYVTIPNDPKGKGFVYSIQDDEAIKKASVVSASKILSSGFADESVEDLVKWLLHPDRRVRLQAQFELVKRKEMKVLEALATGEKNTLLQRLHAIWGLGQLARKEVSVNKQYWDLLGDSNEEVVSQVVKVIGETFDNEAYSKLLSLIDHPSERVRSFLIPALAKCGGTESVSVLLDFARKNSAQDPFLRNAIVTGLSITGDRETLLKCDKDESEAVRLHALLGLLRMEEPQCAKFLNDSSEQIRFATIRGITRRNIEKAIPALASYAERYGSGSHADPEPIMARVIQANFRAGSKASAERIANMAVNRQLDLKVRLICLYELTRWDEKQVVDPVVGQIRSVSSERGLTKEMMIGVLKKLEDEKLEEMLAHLIPLLKQYELPVDDKIVASHVLNAKIPTNDRLNYYRALKESALYPGLTATLAEDSDSEISLAALQELKRIDLARAEKFCLEFVNEGKNLQNAYQVLGGMKSKSSLDALMLGYKKLIAGDHEKASSLDLVIALEKRSESEAGAKTALEEYQSSVAKSDKLGIESLLLHGGSKKRGKQLVEAGKGQCMVCHNFKGEKIVKVGPPLNHVASEKRTNSEYLLKSLITPSDFIVPGFGTGDISTMPPMTGLLSKEEMRDVISYLLTLKKR